MLLFFLKNMVISFIIIILIHHIYDYFKCNLTVPKIKDLVNKPDIQYNEIVNSIKKCNNELNIENNIKIQKKDSQEKIVNMQNELEKFMEELKVSETLPEGLNSDSLFQSF